MCFFPTERPVDFCRSAPLKKHMKVDMVTDMKVDMVANMKVDKVAGMVPE